MRRQQINAHRHIGERDKHGAGGNERARRAIVETVCIIKHEKRHQHQNMAAAYRENKISMAACARRKRLPERKYVNIRNAIK